ncbi:sulfotransferase family protein [Hydrogenophaga sp.]|uniref:sulfotransferase family protein n=1 Tax=Hydrogenophaga sp. TaxID=1904254 RepID=UPI003D9BDF04
MKRMSSKPFFILGCVRSGTTMLRKFLNLHPNLVSPEETQFFRMAEPFGTPGYRHFLLNNPVIKKHREMDGVTEEEFLLVLNESRSRMDLYQRYMTLFMARRKPGATRWFDKSPQNVYGAPMVMASPGVKLVHIYRDPVDVVASLRIGKVMKVESLLGAANYWNEAAEIMTTMKRAYPARVLEVKYEDFIAKPLDHLQQVTEFVGEKFDAAWFKEAVTRETSHRDEGVLSEAEIAKVERLCLVGRKRYGYASAEAGI